MICTFIPPLSLIAKVSQFFKNFTIKNYYDTQLIMEALGAHMRPYGYTYRTPSRDGALQISHSRPMQQTNEGGSLLESLVGSQPSALSSQDLHFQDTLCIAQIFHDFYPIVFILLSLYFLKSFRFPSSAIRIYSEHGYLIDGRCSLVDCLN